MKRPLAAGAAFLISGMAGLVYEVLWSRYLGLFVGHGAYAQVLVLAVYLGGMAVGALAIADVSKRLRNPLRAYAVAELVLAVFGVAFHAVFVAATELSYDVLFPAVGSAGGVGAVRWGVAGALILPQAVVLGTTFPLMAAGLVRSGPDRPGEAVARAYLLNTLGAAGGVLLAGFWLMGAFGLHGTSLAAAVMNLIAAGLVWWATDGVPAAESSAEASAEGPREGVDSGLRPLTAVLLLVSFGTALASFGYEIGWIRMLSLVLGSATHSFELMLSAFILGIAIGAWLVRHVADESDRPVRLLGFVQVGMGLTALASLPLYLLSFGAMANLVQVTAGAPGGYALFNLGRYALCLLVMLPSTILAGATLPLITATLLRAGAGERTIGQVYSVNTIGSVVGAGVAGLLLLPLLGLEGLVTAAAALDVCLGLWLLVWGSRQTGVRLRTAGGLALASLLAFALVNRGVTFDPNTVTSGVYRDGVLSGPERWRSLFYQDGRTATVSAHVGTADGVIVLATNGKPDASLGPRWLMEGRDTLPERPIPQGRDFTTQVLAPAFALGHNTRARTVANIGHGSGMSATSFLTSSELERLVNIEIEPLMVEGSLVFLPANGPAFSDPRVSYVFDDAKSYFSYRGERFDVVFAEPSNPWVSGTASLFTKEFYERITNFMADGAVLAQWMQIYELNDDLFLSVLAAIDAVFPSYRAYLVGDADVAFIATMNDALDDPDWAVVESEAFRTLTASAPPFRPQHMDASLMFDESTFRTVLDAGVSPNSDFRPVLDTGAERARFERSSARGAYSFATSRVDLAGHLSGRTRQPSPYAAPPAYGLAGAVLAARAAWLRGVLDAGGGVAPETFPEWQNDLVHLDTFLRENASGISPRLGSWEGWAAAFVSAENSLHWGTAGWVHPTFYENVYDLLDVAVLAYLRVGRADAARNAFDLLTPRLDREPSHLRNRLLAALIDGNVDD